MDWTLREQEMATQDGLSDEVFALLKSVFQRTQEHPFPSFTQACKLVGVSRARLRRYCTKKYPWAHRQYKLSSQGRCDLGDCGQIIMGKKFLHKEMIEGIKVAFGFCCREHRQQWIDEEA